MKTSIKYFIAFFLFATMCSCGKKDNAEPEERKRDPNELPTEMKVHHFFFSPLIGASRSYIWKYKPFYTSSKHVDSLAPIDTYQIGYKYTYNAKGKPLKLRISDHGNHASYTDIVFTYNAEGTQWLSRKSTSAEREDWNNAKYNSKGERISLDYSTLQGVDSVAKGSRSFIYDEKGNVSIINITERRYNTTHKRWDDTKETMIKWAYEPGKWINGRDVKTEQTKRFEESFVFGEHRPIIYYGQSFGPNPPTTFYVYIGNTPVTYNIAYTFISYGAIWSMSSSQYSSSSGTDQFTINFDYPVTAP